MNYSKYDAIEINTVSRGPKYSDFEVTDDPKKVTYYSVYLHLKTGGVEWVSDHRLKRCAIAKAKSIKNKTGFEIFNFGAK